jgi:hypothetical protein
MEQIIVEQYVIFPCISEGHKFLNITILANKVGFQDVSEDGATELLESHSWLIMNEELAELDSQTCKEVQDGDDAFKKKTP